ncbi:MAG: YrhB domain-containing protein [Pseudomonadota bacterium]
MNREEAQSLVEAELEITKDKYNPIDCAVLEEETIEKPWGWVFFYQSKAYIETGEFMHMLDGNAPIIINRNTAELIHTGTAHDIEYYITEYEKTFA